MTLKEFYQTLNKALLEFPANQHQLVSDILLICYALNRVPINPAKHLKQCLDGQYNHVGGLTFMGYADYSNKSKPHLTLPDIRKGLLQFFKANFGIEFELYKVEMADKDRIPFFEIDTYDSDTDPNKYISRFADTKQVFLCTSTRVYQVVIYNADGFTSAELKLFKHMTYVTISEDRTIVEINHFAHGELYFLNGIKALLESSFPKTEYKYHDNIHYWLYSCLENNPIAETNFTINADAWKIKPFDYQIEGIRFGLTKKRVLIGDDMGLGKTLQALGICDSVPDIRRVIVICPAGLVNTWMKQAKNFPKFEPSSDPRYHHNLLILSYGKLKKYIDVAQSYDAVIVDESHYIKNKTTKRYKEVLDACINKEWRIFLSGTPLQNHTAELIPQLTALGYLNSKEAAQFKARYCRKSFSSNETRHMLEDLNIRLRSLCMIRRLKSEVSLELPDKLRTVIRTDIKNRNEYNIAEQDFIRFLAEIKSYPPEKITLAMRAEQLVKMGHLKLLAAKGIIDDVVEFTENILEQGNSVLIFTQHLELQKEYISRLNASYYINGAMSMHMRTNMEENFMNSEGPCVMVLQTRSAGVGLTLTKATYVVHAEKDWVPAWHNQSRDRTHRIGQTQTVNEYFFTAERTVDDRIMQILEEKEFLTEHGIGDDAMLAKTSLIKDILESYGAYVSDNDNELLESTISANP